jgi:hypothetical protein
LVGSILVTVDAINKRALAQDELQPLQPFVDAIVDAIGHFVDPKAAERAEALERVKQANRRLARQGYPSGLMSGDGICVDGEDSNAPTEFRAVKSEFEIISTSHTAGRDRSTEAWRVVPLIERMRKNSQIDDSELQAAGDFHRYFTVGHRVGGLTMRYGEQTGSGGTPPGQQVDIFNHRGEIKLAPDELRTMYSGLWAAGYKALLTKEPMPIDRFIAAWVQKVVCEDYALADGDKEPTLEDIGKAFLSFRDVKQARAAGVSLIKQGLERLAHHYGISKNRSS